MTEELYSQASKEVVARRLTVQRIKKEVHIAVGSGEMSLEIPGIEAIGTLVIHLNNSKQYRAVMVNDELHYSIIRALILREIVYNVESKIESGETTRSSLQKAGYFNTFKEIQRHLALAYSHNIRVSQEFMRINRKELLEIAALIVDLITLHDIQEDEAQSEPEQEN